LLAKVEDKLHGDVKASLGDYIRLIQLQKELEEDEVREIKVTWVDPEAGTSTEAPDLETQENLETPENKQDSEK
jgi:hypothetical protein